MQRRGSEDVERVREATDLVQLVGQYVNLKRAGRNFKGLCPFHSEKTPSFMVSPERQLYHCFGCHKGGDAFSFVMGHDGVSFAEALRLLAERAGIALEAQAERGGAHDALYGAAEQAASFYEARLRSAEGDAARRYLDERGLAPETVRRFRIGYAPPGWNTLGAGLAGDDAPALLQLGLVSRSSRGTGTYDTFRDRLIFPVQSLSGRVVGFGGRILPRAAGGEEGPKYLNTPDSPIYHKGKLLYGLAEARAAVRRHDGAILTEGYLDFLSLFQAGIEHVVAACGTAFSPHQAALLHRYTARAYILGDSDPAGRRAAVRTAGMLLEHGFLAYIVELPRGYDPDSFVREHGRAALETRLREAPGYIAYMKLLVDRRAGDLAVKERVLRHLLDDLTRVTDPLMLELYRKEIGRIFAFSEAALEAAIAERRGRGRVRVVASAGPAEETARPAVREAQRGLLRLGLAGPPWSERLGAALVPEDFAAGPERALFEALLDAAAGGGGWMGRLEDEADRTYATRLAFEEVPPGEPERLFADYVATVRGARLESVERDVLRQMAEAQARGDLDAERRLMAEHQALVQERSALRRRATWT